MMNNTLIRTLLLTASLGGLAGLANTACVITVGSLDCDECGNTGCNNQVVGDTCLCDQGYEMTGDDFECTRIPPKGGDANCGNDPDNPVHLEGDVCVCDDGYNWCSPDPNDLSCCEDDMQIATGGVDTGDPPLTTGEDTGPGDTTVTVDETGDPPGECSTDPAPNNGVEPAAADCTEDGLVFCSNTEAEGPAGSRYWECLGGEWVESPTVGDESCQFDGFAFAYGCVDDGSSVTFVCGDGPGTDCSGPECDGCADDGDQILFCQDGKLGGDSCNRICTEDGDAKGITYDFGSCVVNEAGTSECACCDAGEEGCPLE